MAEGKVKGFFKSIGKKIDDAQLESNIKSSFKTGNKTSSGYALLIGIILFLISLLGACKLIAKFTWLPSLMNSLILLSATRLFKLEIYDTF